MTEASQKYVKHSRPACFKRPSRSFTLAWLCLLSATGAIAGQSPYTYVHHPVSTDVASAQFAIDRGLTLVFAYESGEAERSFREAASLDPTLAMAWWGIALALGPDINTEPTPR